jgi:hypothetical protein
VNVATGLAKRAKWLALRALCLCAMLDLTVQLCGGAFLIEKPRDRRPRSRKPMALPAGPPDQPHSEVLAREASLLADDGWSDLLAFRSGANRQGKPKATEEPLILGAALSKQLEPADQPKTEIAIRDENLKPLISGVTDADLNKRSGMSLALFLTLCASFGAGAIFASLFLVP